jgi:hypothetical protein
MEMKKIMINSYMIALTIVIILAMIDSDVIVSIASLVLDVLVMSVLCWTVVFPISILVSRIKTKNEKKRSNS